jgi:CheY-like chemotaxis protein
MTDGDIKNASSKSGRGNHSLLLVDSDVQHLSYLSQLLERLEYRTSTATTAREALDAAVPSLIITALDLSDMSGLNFMKLMRDKPAMSNVPYVVIKKSDDSDAGNYYRAGAACCLSRPVAIEALYQAVQAAIETTPRTCIRLRTIQPVKVDTVPFDNYAGMHTLALSERGMFLHSVKQAPANTRLALRINLSGLIIAAEAKVLYTGKSNRGSYQEPGMGLEFVQIAPNDQQFIRKFIRTEVTKGIVPAGDSPYSA